MQTEIKSPFKNETSFSPIVPDANLSPIERCQEGELMMNDALHKLRIQAEERMVKREHQIESLERAD